VDDVVANPPGSGDPHPLNEAADAPSSGTAAVGSAPPSESDAPVEQVKQRRNLWPHNGPPNTWSKLQILGTVLAVLAVASVVIGSFIRLPYYRLSPGNVHDTIERVEAPVDQVFIPDGEIGFVTVSQTANITPWQWLDAQLDEHSIIRHEDEIQGTRTRDETRQADLRRMQVSKNSAVVVALNRLGFDLNSTPIGIEVASVFPCTAAEGSLGTGDLIIGVNGVDVRDGESLSVELRGLGVGQPVELLVERIDPDNPAQSAATELVGLTLGSADDECLPDDVRAEEPRPFIGIGTLTIVEEDFPIEIDVRTGRVSGPSAGLAFTLAIMDVLSEGELTNGMNVVATGTIDRDGNVGPVGGIHQKTIAAERAGADVLLVPLCCDNFVDPETRDPVDVPSNYDEALQYVDSNDDMIVIGVNDLDDALRAIGELGGDVDQFLVDDADSE